MDAFTYSCSMRGYSLFLLLLLSFTGWSQTAWQVHDLQWDTFPGQDAKAVEQVTTWINLPASQPFLAINLEVIPMAAVQEMAVQVEYQTDRDALWQALPWDEHVQHDPSRWLTSLAFLDPGHDRIRFRLTAGQGRADHSWRSIRLHTFDPGPTGLPDRNGDPISVLRSDQCSCAPPALVDRAQWCPDGSCFPHPSPEPVFPTHLIIHHSAGSNSSSDWAAVVRSIWNFHVNVNGWSDIGYNWLIDPDGQIYIGRGDDILGAHFCGKNSNTLGTCVMGDFTQVQPKPAAIDALSHLYAWKACVEEIDPLGSSWHPASGAVIPNVSGHRQSCQTSCPGDAFFPILPQVRNQIAEVIIECDCDVLPPTQLTVQAQTDQVSLQWEAVPGATGYRLERKGPIDADFALLAQVGNTVYLDQNVEPGQTYRYRVRAFDGVCTSNPSDPVAIVVPTEWLVIRPTLVTDQVEVSIRNLTADPVSMTLYAVNGQIVWAGEFGKSAVDFDQVIPMAAMPAGLYVLRVRHGHEIRTLRLTKM